MSSHLISNNPRERLIDRELSWLSFNERVLELAEDESNPLLERCRYLAIFSSNYSITNLEYHLKLNQSSSIYSISDFGYSENKITRIKSNLYSFGIGYAINNEKSSTNLMYAVGKTDSKRGGCLPVKHGPRRP